MILLRNYDEFKLFIKTGVWEKLFIYYLILFRENALIFVCRIFVQFLKLNFDIYMDQNSEILDPHNKLSEENPQKKGAKQQVPFYRSSAISFVKVGHCHMCKARNKIVYQCYRNFQATSCQKKFCLDCLVLIYKQNIVETLQKSDNWRCPYHRKVCRCKNCCASRKQQFSVLELDSNISVYANLRQKIRMSNEDEDQELEVDESTKCLLKQKFKKVLQINGQMINKVNTYYHKLTKDQIKFYSKLIHSHLRVMNHLAKNMITHQTVTEE